METEQEIKVNRMFYPDGKLQYELHYLNREPCGTHKSWNEDGSLASEHRYENGLLNGLCVVYRKDGSVWYKFICSNDLQEGEEHEHMRYRYNE